MDCQEFEKKIPAFISDELNFKELKCFLEHVEHCPDCKEELTIQVLISEGMAHLEEGGAFDLQEEIEKYIAHAKHRIRNHKLFFYIRTTLEFLALAALAVAVLLKVF